MAKIDLKTELKHLYQPPKGEFVIVDVPPMNFLMVDGAGDPNTTLEYQQAVEALYAVAYGVKFASKRQLGVDYVVPPLEGLWWADDVKSFIDGNKSLWQWTMMIALPAHVTPALVDGAIAETAKKKELPALSLLRMETYHEGLSVQTTYIGAYADEGPTIARMHALIEEQGYRIVGKHHEIYMSDPRRVAPDKLRTVIRQPVAV